MHRVGWVFAKDDTRVDHDRWLEAVRRHPNLSLPEPGPPKEVINPFTGEAMVVQPKQDIASIVVDGREIGQLKWRRERREAIQVFGDLQVVRPIAEEVASTLGAQFQSDPLWQVLGPVWDSIGIYEGPAVFLDQFRTVRPEVGHLFAAHWCQSEVNNGGFYQFFTNSTGVLAPEALEGFQAMGLREWAAILGQAMTHFGAPYPRDREQREAKLAGSHDGPREEWDPFHALDEPFYEWSRSEPDRFGRVATEYARSIIDA